METSPVPAGKIKAWGQHRTQRGARELLPTLTVTKVPGAPGPWEAHQCGDREPGEPWSCPIQAYGEQCPSPPLSAVLHPAAVATSVNHHLKTLNGKFQNYTTRALWVEHRPEKREEISRGPSGDVGRPFVQHSHAARAPRPSLA